MELRPEVVPSQAASVSVVKLRLDLAAFARFGAQEKREPRLHFLDLGLYTPVPGVHHDRVHSVQPFLRHRRRDQAQPEVKRRGISRMRVISIIYTHNTLIAHPPSSLMVHLFA